jgi:hypothetical protein
LNAADFFCVLAEPVETPSARSSATTSASGKAKANLLFLMFSSLLFPGVPLATIGRRARGA